MNRIHLTYTPKNTFKNKQLLGNSRMTKFRQDEATKYGLDVWKINDAYENDASFG